jgi:hypothetical protein
MFGEDGRAGCLGRMVEKLECGRWLERMVEQLGTIRMVEELGCG